MDAPGLMRNCGGGALNLLLILTEEARRVNWMHSNSGDMIGPFEILAMRGVEWNRNDILLETSPSFLLMDRVYLPK
jgi:hypothetical protein